MDAGLGEVPASRVDWARVRVPWRLLKWVGVAFGGTLLLAGLVALAWWSMRPAAPAEMTDIASDWNATVRRLGIEPIYPPQEDFQVGDIYASAFGAIDDAPTLAGRAVKIYHYDMRPDLERVQSQLIAFPATMPRPADNGAVWPQPHSDDSPFGTAAAPPKGLSLAVFPGFTLGHVRHSGSDAGGVFRGVSAAITQAGESDDDVELRIPFAETYGVPSLVATGRLDMFCEDETTRDACSDDFLRRQLSMVAGKAVFEPGVSVELILVSRVYLARAIEQVHSSQSAVGANVRIAAKLRDVSAAAADAPAPDQSQPPGIDVAKTLAATISRQRQQLDALAQDIGNGRNGLGATAQAAESGRIAITQTFERPVAFGYRAVRRSFSPEPGSPAATNAPK